MKKNLKIIISIAAVSCICVVTWYTFRKSPTTVGNTKPDYIIQPNELVDEFNSDENSANQKYLDKTIQISAVVADIEKSSEENTVIYLEGSLMGNISCSFSNEELKSINIEIGNTITVKGKCTGYIMDVVLTKCALIE